MTELRHLQLVILDIIKDIDIVCKNNGIEYYLLGGSAIGAIRHKGFIPWDDDIDIFMMENEYKKLIDLILSSWTMCHRIDFLHIGNMFVQRFCYAISCR